MSMPRNTAHDRAEAALRAMTEDEDTAINAGIAQDGDSRELTAEDMARMRPAREVVPEIADRYRRTRGPQKAPTKQLVSLRLDREVIERFKATGPGWQARINEALRKAAP